MRILLVLFLLPLIGLAGPEGRRYDVNVHLAGRTEARPPAEIVYEMRGPAPEVVLHLVWRNGLYRKSRHDNTRGTTAGVYLELNDADLATHPVRNPFVPLPLQPGLNPDWKDFVARDFPFPNPEPGYWYTWAKHPDPLERELRIRFAAPGRYRIRVRGVLPDDRKDKREPTLQAVTEIGPALDRPAPDYRKKVMSPDEPGAAAVPELEPDDPNALAVPTGHRATSVLLVRREAPAEVSVGTAYHYEISVTNLTKEPVVGVVLIETGETKLKYGAGPTDADETTASWDLGTLEAGETKKVGGEATPLQEGELVRAVIVRYDSTPLVQTATVAK